MAKNSSSSIFKTKPFFVSKIWGGQKLAKLFGSTKSGVEFNNKKPQHEEEKIGEAWLVSNLGEGNSFVEDIPFQQFADDYKLKYQQSFWGENDDRKIVVKYIDAEDDLSVQVHPTDEIAKENPLLRGKDEFWLILDAAPGAGIYLGLKPGVDRQSFFEAAMDTASDNRQVQHYLNFFPCSRGDYFFVPAGMVHAIGRGIFLLEVQQNSGVTYRLWDWNRVDDAGRPRQLHIAEGKKYLNDDSEFNQIIPKNLGATGLSNLHTHWNFKIDYFKVQLGENRKIHFNSNNLKMLIVISGEVELTTIPSNLKNQSLLFRQGECALIDKREQEIQINVVAKISNVAEIVLVT